MHYCHGPVSVRLLSYVHLHYRQVIPAGVVDHRLNLTVWDHGLFSPPALQRDCAERHLLDGTLNAAYRHIVAHGKLIFKEQEHACHYVAYEALRADAQGKGTYAGGRQHGVHRPRKAQLAYGYRYGDKIKHITAYAHRNRYRRIYSVGKVGLILHLLEPAVGYGLRHLAHRLYRHMGHKEGESYVSRRGKPSQPLIRQ